MIFGRKIIFLLTSLFIPCQNRQLADLCISQITNIMDLIHLAFFYFEGKYLTFQNRLLTINYSSTELTQRINTNVLDTGYETLGLITVIQALCKLFLNAPNWVKKLSFQNRIIKETKITNPKAQCPVCYEDTYIGDPIQGPCGHFVCWACILKCIPINFRESDFPCPICRFPNWNFCNIFPIYF